MEVLAVPGGAEIKGIASRAIEIIVRKL